MAQVGSLNVNLALESAQFIAGMKKAAAQTQSTAASISKALGTAKAAIGGLAAAFAVDWMADQVQKAFDYADAIQDLSDRTGASTKFIQEFGYAAQLSGSSVENARTAIEKFSKNLGAAQNGSEAMRKTLHDLGVTSTDVDTAVKQAADGIAKMDSKSEQAAATVAVFGKSGQDLVMTLSAGSAGLNEMAQRAAELGIVLDKDVIANAGKVNDQLDTMKMILSAQMANAIVQNADAIAGLGDAFGAIIGNISEAVRWIMRFRAERDAALAQNTLDGWFSTDAQKDVARAQLNDARGRLSNIDQRGPEMPTLIWDAAKGKLVDGAKHDTKPSTGGTLALPKADTPKAKTGKTPAELAAEAFQKDMDWKNEWLGGEREFLGLKERRTPNVADQRDYQLQQNEIETQQRTNSLMANGPKGSKKFDANQLAMLLQQEEQIAAEKAKLISLEADEKLAREQLDVHTASIGNDRDLLSSAHGLARTQADRREIGLRLIDLQFQQEKLALEAVKHSAAATDAEKQIAQARLDILDKLKANDIAGVKQSTMGPLEGYLDSLPKIAGEIQESIEGAAIGGLESLNHGLIDAIKGTGDLKDALGSMFDTVVDGILNIAIQQALIKPLGSLLFGGDSSGGGLFGGVIKSIAGGLAGARANGGLTRAGNYLVGERGPEVVSVGNTASVTPNHALNAISGRGGTNMQVTIGDITSNDPEAVRAMIYQSIAEAAPMLTKRAVDATKVSLQRPRM
jgi:hypothetical protein